MMKIKLTKRTLVESTGVLLVYARFLIPALISL